MRPYVEGSLIVRAFGQIVRWYSYSFCKRIFSGLSAWYQASATHRFFERYMTKKSTAQHTLVFRVLQKGAWTLDKAVGKIHDRLAKHADSSLIVNLFMFFQRSVAATLFLLLSGFGLGYMITTSLIGEFSMRSFQITLALLVISCLCAVLSTQTFRRWSEASLVRSLYLKLWK